MLARDPRGVSGSKKTEVIMLKNRWFLRDALVVFILRLLLGAIIARLVLPVLNKTDYLSLQVVDSSILIILVAVFLRWRRTGVTGLFNRSRVSLESLVVWGVGTGLLLFVLGNWSETWIKNNLLVDFGSHPLLRLTMEVDRAGQFLLPFFVGSVLVPVAEELFYRGFLFPPLAARIGTLGGILLAGLIFAATHFNQVWLVEIFLGGVALTWLFHRFQSLWPGLIAHIVLNAGRLIMIYLAV